MLILWLFRVYQFSKRNALEDSRQQVVLSMVARARLEAQRRVLADKLQSLGSKEAPGLGLDDDRISITSNSSAVSSIILVFKERACVSYVFDM